MNLYYISLRLYFKSLLNIERSPEILLFCQQNSINIQGSPNTQPNSQLYFPDPSKPSTSTVFYNIPQDYIVTKSNVSNKSVLETLLQSKAADNSTYSVPFGENLQDINIQQKNIIEMNRPVELTSNWPIYNENIPQQIQNLQETTRQPENLYYYQAEMVEKGKRLYKFRHDWIFNFDWLQYDERQNIMYCRVCRKWNRTMPSFTRTSFVEGNSNFRLEIINHHNNCKTHKMCMERESRGEF